MIVHLISQQNTNGSLYFFSTCKVTLPPQTAIWWILTQILKDELKENNIFVQLLPICMLHAVQTNNTFYGNLKTLEGTLTSFTKLQFNNPRGFIVQLPWLFYFPLKAIKYSSCTRFQFMSETCVQTSQKHHFLHICSVYCRLNVHRIHSESAQCKCECT